MHETKKVTLIDALLNFFPAILAFLMPVFFLALTAEFYEFNKLALLTLGTFVTAAFWIANMILKKKVYVTRSMADIGLLGLFVSVLISSVFSLNKVSSIYGSYGRWFPSLFSVAIMIFYYYAVSANVSGVKAIKTALYAFMGGSTIATIVALLAYFGIKLSSAAHFQASNFTLTGSGTSTALLAALVVVLALTFVLNSKTVMAKILSIQILALNLLGVLFLGTLPVFAALAAGVLAVLYFTPYSKINPNKPYLLILGGVVIALTLVFAVPVTRGVLINKNYPKELLLPSKESRIVSMSVLRDYPLIGSGPSTFGLVSTIYRSLGMNTSDFWNARFDKASSEVFNVVASLGLVGVAVMLFLAYRVFKLMTFAKSLKSDKGEIAALCAVLSALGIFFVLSYATVLTSFLFITFLAFLVSLLALENEHKGAQNVALSLASLGQGNNSSMSILSEAVEKSEILPYIMAVPMAALIVFGTYQFSRVYLGEYYMRKAIVAASNNNGAEALQMQANAIRALPRGGERDSYHNVLAQTSILIATNLSRQTDLTDQDKQNIQVLISQALNSSKATTETINPLNVSNWETRAMVYKALIATTKDADQWAVNSYNSAIQLDPSNPRLRLDLGSVYYSKGDYMNAANLFRQAVSLKPDYANARYNYAHALVQLKYYADAQRELELIQKLVPAESEDYKKLVSDIEEVKGLAEQSGQTVQDSKPNVEQIEAEKAITESKTTENQEPLVEPGGEATE